MTVLDRKSFCSEAVMGRPPRLVTRGCSMGQYGHGSFRCTARAFEVTIDLPMMKLTRRWYSLEVGTAAARPMKPGCGTVRIGRKNSPRRVLPQGRILS